MSELTKINGVEVRESIESSCESILGSNGIESDT